MDRRQFVQKTFITMTGTTLVGSVMAGMIVTKKEKQRFRLLRHATLVVEIAGKKILVDPMLSKKEALDPIPNAANSWRIPLVDLPIDEASLAKVLAETDAVLITHTHRDHWDVAAQQLIAKNKLLFCQPADETKLKEQGFINVQAVDKTFTWGSIELYRTNGQHGTGELGKKMGTVSGYVLQHNKSRLYIAGDTIWCCDVEKAITTHQPTHIIINGGGARFLQGDPITMTTTDLLALAQFTSATVTVVHLESVNHCFQRRKDFREAIQLNHFTSQVNIPEDGDWISF
jgi:L-ascorbate metabolism protein UlaG (beta-lactamase superfamily)